MKRLVVVLWVIAIATAVLFGSACAGPPPAPLSPAAPMPTFDAGSMANWSEYRFARWVLEVTLDRFPLARTLCEVRVTTNGEIASTVVAWDPAERSGLVRRVLFDPRKSELKVTCGAENFVIGANTKEAPARYLTYDFSDEIPFNDGKAVCGTLQELGAGPKSNGTDAGAPSAPVATPALASASDAGADADAAPAPLRRVCAPNELQVSWRQDGAITADELGASDLSRGLTRTRSLDPLTSLASDLAVTLASIALERAKTQAARLVEDMLVEAFGCAGDDAADAGASEDGRSADATRTADADSGDGTRVRLDRTCKVIRTMRVQELAADPKPLARALSADFIDWFTRRTRSQLGGDAVATAIMDTLGDAVTSLIEGRAASTEREVQLLVLPLSHVKIPPAGSNVPGSDWACAVGMGYAVLLECIQEGECTSDQLSRLIRQERSASEFNNLRTCDVARALDHWPELPTILGRSLDVLRPPPGATPRTTARVAFNVLIDVLEKRMSSQGLKSATLLAAEAATSGCLAKAADGGSSGAGSSACADASAECIAATTECDKAQREKACLVSQTSKVCNDKTTTACALREQKCTAYNRCRVTEPCKQQIAAEADARASNDALVGHFATAHDRLESLRGVVNGVVSDDIQGALIAAATELSRELSGHADRGFRILGALISYAATYAHPSAGEGKTEEERAKDASEQRRKAMEAFLDAATDRRQRDRQWVVSVGASVGGFLGCTGTVASKGSCLGTEDSSSPFQLTMPTGFALQLLPDGRSDKRVLAGLHFQLNLVDLAQFLHVRSNGTIAEPNPGSWIYLGTNIGVLLGRPEISVLLSFDAGYAPTLDMGDGGRGAWRAGGMLGIYVPFLDFN